MTHHVYDEYSHLTSQQMLFPDGRIRSAFLLSSVSRLSGRRFYAQHLQQLRLRPGVDYMHVHVSDLPNLLQREVKTNAPRIVLSESGLWQLVLHGRSDFSDQLRWWLVDDVIPAVMRDGYYSAPETDQMVAELRSRVAMLEAAADFGWDTTLGDLVGRDDR